MATHPSVLAWRIPGMGSHRVGHDWSDLAAAVALSLDIRVRFDALFLSHLLPFLADRSSQETLARKGLAEVILLGQRGAHSPPKHKSPVNRLGWRGCFLHCPPVTWTAQAPRSWTERAVWARDRPQLGTPSRVETFKGKYPSAWSLGSARTGKGMQGSCV